MALQSLANPTFKVFVRWRPLEQKDAVKDHCEYSRNEENSRFFISLTQPSTSKQAKSWKSGASFSHIFEAADVNDEVYERAIRPMLPNVLQGGESNIFAYGHSGSGKTHTIIGYDFEHRRQLGLTLRTAHELFRATEGRATFGSSDNVDEDKLKLAVRLYEVRGSCAYDLFNDGTECHVREGPDGLTHIRGKTEMLENGKVRVRPIKAIPCSSYEQLQETVVAGLKIRKTGFSSVHDVSSRTHAILELEIVSNSLMDAREAVIERESELVPVGKRATDIYLEEHMASLVKSEDGKYEQNPDRPLNQSRIDEAEAEKQLFESRVKEAEGAVTACLQAGDQSALGGKFIFVDLAGSEYYDQGANGGPKQTLAEKKQGRQINTDLFALKEVIRARAGNQTRIPYRSSPLTMVLRSHFQATKNAESAMILTVNPAADMYNATVNTLKYGNLVGLGGA